MNKGGEDGKGALLGHVKNALKSWIRVGGCIARLWSTEYFNSGFRDAMHALPKIVVVQS